MAFEKIKRAPNSAVLLTHCGLKLLKAAAVDASHTGSAAVSLHKIHDGRQLMTVFILEHQTIENL